MPSTLRELADRCHFTFGAAAISEPNFLAKPAYRQLHAQHFNLLVPAGAMKCHKVCKTPQQYNFTLPDAVVDFARQNQQKVRGHTLCWHDSYAPWMTSLTSLELEKVLRDFIITTVEHYRGRIYAYDVVNEALKDDGYPRNSIWRSVENFIPKCFQWAHEADPEAHLIYLDYRVISQGRWQAITKMVRELRAAGIPIHGVGLQLHHDLFRSIATSSVRLASVICDLKQLGVAVHISEITVGVRRSAQGLPPAVKFNLQAQAYRQIVKIALESGAESCNLWGYTDLHGFHMPPECDLNDTPAVFDEHLQPKPAYHAICDELTRYANRLERSAA